MNTIFFNTGKTVTYEKYIKCIDLLEYFENPENVIAIRINNEICSLSDTIITDVRVEPIYLNTSEGASVYRHSLCFVLATASYNLFPKKRLLVSHSLGRSFYYTIEDQEDISEENIDLLKKEMLRIVKKNERIDSKYMCYEQAINLFKEMNCQENIKMMSFNCQNMYFVNTLEKFHDLYFAPLVYSTGILKVFDLKKYKEGFLLHFPKSDEPEKLGNLEVIPQLFNIYKEYKDWGKKLGVSSVSALNQIVMERKTKEFIDITESLQAKHISDIAYEIFNRKSVKLVLMAGPSSSGKTTSSKKIALQLRTLGYQPKLLELDSYYVDKEHTPVNEKGEYDYECLESLDIPQLNQDLNDLFNGKSIKVPSYNFKEGERYYTGKEISLAENDILIMEGIHGLDDKLTPSIPDDIKFKIYLSALTQLNLDDHNRISTTDNRLIRRIVRDSQFRGKTAVDTIKMWPNVTRGEKLYIFPFQDKADALLNTALDYELSVLKSYALPLLKCVTPLEREFSEASRLITFLQCFSAIPATDVPGQSIIREFIGGSEFKY